MKIKIYSEIQNIVNNWFLNLNYIYLNFIYTFIKLNTNIYTINIALIQNIIMILNVFSFFFVHRFIRL